MARRPMARRANQKRSRSHLLNSRAKLKVEEEFLWGWFAAGFKRGGGVGAGFKVPGSGARVGHNLEELGDWTHDLMRESIFVRPDFR